MSEERGVRCQCESQALRSEDCTEWQEQQDGDRTEPSRCTRPVNRPTGQLPGDERPSHCGTVSHARTIAAASPDQGASRQPRACTRAGKGETK